MRESLAFVKECTDGKREEEGKCIMITLIAAQAAIKSFGK